MNKKGRQFENNDAVRVLVEKAVELDTDIYKVIDDAGQELVVDIDNGTVHRLVGNELVECNTGSKSVKRNGYVYVALTLNIDGQLKLVNYGQHSLIAMLAYTAEYDMYVANDVSPVANHKDNCHWNNAQCNLEWTTQKYNIMHGKIVSTLHRVTLDELQSSNTRRLFTRIAHNKGKKDFVVLLKPLSCKDIEKFEASVVGGECKSLKQYFGLSADTDTIPWRLLMFLLNYIEEKLGKTTCVGEPVTPDIARDTYGPDERKVFNDYVAEYRRRTSA